MNKNFYKILFLLLLLKPSFGLFAENKVDATSEYPISTEIYLYQNDFAFIREIRNFELENPKTKQKEILLKIKNLPTQIIFDTIFLKADKIEWIFLDYKQKEHENSNYLSNFKGKELDIRTKNNISYKKSKILDVTKDFIVYQAENEIFTEKIENIIFSTKDFEYRPNILLKMKNNNTDSIELYYLTKNLSYSTNYNLFIDKNNNARLESFVTITNNSGVDFKNVNLNLFIGDVIKINKTNNSNFVKTKNFTNTTTYKNTMPTPIINTNPNSFSIHRFGNQNKFDIFNKMGKIIPFFDIKNIKIDGKYEINTSYNYIAKQYHRNIEEKIYAHNKIRFINTSDFDFSKGKIKIFRENNNDFVFISENFIENISQNDEIKLNLGESFNIYSTRKQLNYKKLDNDIYEIEWELTVYNFDKNKVKVDLIENIIGDWEIINSNLKYEKNNYKNIKFNLEIEPNQNIRVKYSFRTRL
ncbi:MAG: DUF4139 domain-containing protein [Elusimicrobiota bacterium]|jgi:hypothetical protein|nr:DUF4139 domain-containing protein [Elusimicrobiota bacterium]